MVAYMAAVMLAVALVFSMLGQGGGVLYTPIQLLFGVEFHQAATTSLFLILATALSASTVFSKARMIDWRMALVLESATTSGAFLGGVWSGRFSGIFLTFLFAAVVFVAGFFMVKQFAPGTRGRGEGGRFCWRRRLGDEEYRINLAVALPVSFAAGVVSGMVGVSGGILKVPMMVLLFGVPMGIAVGSSAFMVTLTAAGGLAGHMVSGHMEWQSTLALAVFVVAGAQIGSRIGVRLDKKKMKNGFGWFLLGMAVLLVVREAVMAR